MNYREDILKLTDKVIDLSLVNKDDIPKIDLYMEQMISFLEQELGDSLRQSDETVFTKTMVNNYTKAGILPRPEKKKYNREHIISLVYIFLLKQVLSIQDIKTFFTLMEAEDRDAGQIEVLYSVFSELFEELKPDVAAFAEKYMDKIDKKFEENGMESEGLKAVSFISIMALAANINKYVCNRLLDAYSEKEEPAEDNGKSAAKGKGKGDQEE